MSTLKAVKTLASKEELKASERLLEASFQLGEELLGKVNLSDAERTFLERLDIFLEIIGAKK